MKSPTKLPAPRDGRALMTVTCPNCDLMIARAVELWRAALITTSHEAWCIGRPCFVQRVGRDD